MIESSRNNEQTSSLDSASHIKGNVSDREKHLALKIFSYFVSSPEKSYGASVGQRLKLVEVNVWDRDSPAARGETVFEVDIERDMCNIFGTLHGGCAAYIFDPCSASSLIVLGTAIGVDATGVTQSMNLIWHRPVHLGNKIRIVSKSTFIHGRIQTARSEMWHGDQLCISAILSTVKNNPNKKDSRKSKL